jgi:integrase
MLATLLGCGLRRAELVKVKIEDLDQREEHWVIVNLVGKGGHVRTVPMPQWVKNAIDQWVTCAEYSVRTDIPPSEQSQPDFRKWCYPEGGLECRPKGCYEMCDSSDRSS